jgi:biotin-(acetyl-CoA carboxylase) ligase
MTYYIDLINQVPNQLIQEYNDHLFYKNNEIQFKTKNEDLKNGRIVEVNSSGQLAIYSNDKLQHFDFGEVEIIYFE